MGINKFKAFIIFGILLLLLIIFFIIIFLNNRPPESKDEPYSNENNVSIQQDEVMRPTLELVSYKYPNLYEYGDFKIATKYVEDGIEGEIIITEDSDEPNLTNIEPEIYNWAFSLTFNNIEYNCRLFRIDLKEKEVNTVLVDVVFLNEIDSDCDPNQYRSVYEYIRGDVNTNIEFSFSNLDGITRTSIMPEISKYNYLVQNINRYKIDNNNLILDYTANYCKDFELDKTYKNNGKYFIVLKAKYLVDNCELEIGESYTNVLTIPLQDDVRGEDLVIILSELDREILMEGY